MPSPVLVPDTHIFLHGRDFTEIRWSEFLPGAVLGFAMPVIDELDAWKGKRADSNLANRARNLGRQIHKALTDGKTPRGTVVFDLPTQKRVQIEALGLDPDSKDQHLIADVIAYREATGRDVRIVTMDNGMRIRCRIKGIPVFEFPEDLVIQVRDDRDVKISKLEQENVRLRQVLPKLELVASEAHGAEPPLVIKSLAPPPMSEDSKARAKREVDQAQHALVYNRPRGLTFPSSEIARVQKELRDHELELAVHYAELAKAQQLLSQTFQLDLNLENFEGGAPGKNVDIALELPNGFHFVPYGDLPIEPKRPVAPTPVPNMPAGLAYASDLAGLANLFHSDLRFDGLRASLAALEPPANASGPFIEFDSPATAHLHVRSLKHGTGVVLPGVFFQALESNPTGVSLAYRVAADNDPEIRTRKLEFRLEVGDTIQWRESEESAT